MKATSKALWVQKNGNAPDEYEDASSGDTLGRQSPRRFAVADGATESLLSGPWARTLVSSFCEYPTANIRVEHLAYCAWQQWKEWRDEYLAQRHRAGKPIAWYEEPGLRAGAYATLLGLIVRRPRQGQIGRWKAFAIGDSCLFQMREGLLVVQFPLQSSAGFDNSPSLICSVAGRNETLQKTVQVAEGEWRIGDRFLLMTDALAKWFMVQNESGHSHWENDEVPLRAIDQGEFAEWVDSRREADELRNDDVTLLHIEMA